MSRRVRFVTYPVVALVLCGWLYIVAGRPPTINAADAPAPASTAPAGPQRHRPRTSERARARLELVRRHVQREGLRDTAVLEAMRQVPRHWFVPRHLLGAAYDDRPLPIGHGQTISQPFIVAYMTQHLALKPTDKVLEIGTGSGYQAAVLSELTPHVFTIEIVRKLGEAAKARFAQRGYKTIQAKVADGYHGWPEHGPFDAILVTCASGTIPPPLVRQLKPGGRMCIPVGPTGAVQRLILVTKDADGKIRSRSLIPVRFVPLTRRRR